MSFLSRTIDHSRATLAILVLILFLGAISRASMTIEVNPNIQVPVVLIIVTHEGISPEDGTRLLVRPVEKELKTLDGLEEITATAREGAVYITVEFDIEADPGKILADTREAVNRAKAEFPEETNEPIVNEISASPEPTIVVNFSGEQVSEREIYKAAKFIQRQLETLPDVLEAAMIGNREEVVEVILDPWRLQQYNITSAELLASVRSNNLLIPAGELDAAEGRFGIKVPALIETTEDIRRLPIRTSTEGVVTLGDVAEVQRTFKDATDFSTLNGKNTISINVSKRVTANSIETVAAVRETIDQHRNRFSRNIEIEYIFDSSDSASSMVSELSGNILTAMSLVVVLVIATLGIRSGLLVGFGIPFCLLGSIIIINLLGFSFNFMVMFGLLLALGMLIDGAIVVVEFANTRISEGMPAREAYMTAVRRMAIPVIASTATTLAAFLPLLFWPGVAGRFMSFLPTTVFSVLAWSLLYALVFAPALGVAISKRKREKKVSGENHKAENEANTLIQPLVNNYLKLLKLVVMHPLQVALAAVVLLISIFFLYGKYGGGQAFFNDIETQYGLVNIRAQGNLSVAEKKRLTDQVESIVRTVPKVQNVYSSSQDGSIGSAQQKSRDEISSILVELIPKREREESSAEVFSEIRKRVKELPGIFVTGNPVEGGPPVGKDIQIQVSSPDRQAMHRTAKLIRQWVEENVEGIRDPEDTLPLAGIEWEIVVDRPQAAILGVDVNSVGQMVQMVTNGIRIGEFRPDDADDEVEMRLRYPKENRHLASLDDLRVNTANGPVPVSSFTQRLAKPRVDTIQRVDMQESVFVMANTEEGYVTDQQTRQIQQWLEKQDIDPTVTVKFRGANEEQTKAAEFLSTAFSLAMFLMLILLVAQFNSFYQAFLILFSVVLSTAGVLLGLLITQSIFSTVLTGVGIVALAGIVVNNNIVLIDSYNYLRRTDPNLNPVTAVVEAAKSRFRPVMLTTVTTIVGLLPLANGLSIDIINRTWEYGGEIASWWQVLASAIVNGLGFATIMTLLLTPAMLILPELLCGRLKSQVAEAHLNDGGEGQEVN